jgi:hypothetical protein
MLVNKSIISTNDVVALVLRLARHNPRCGCQRIVGELAGVGVRVSATSVAKILREANLGGLPTNTPAQHDDGFTYATGSRYGVSVDAAVPDRASRRRA